MKTAVISDIHGNLPALRAVLADARAQGARRYVFLGDYIFDLPWSNEVCRELRSLENAVFISGNKEQRLPHLSLNDPEARDCDQVASVYQHLRELEPEAAAWLMSLPERAEIPLESGGSLLAVHKTDNKPALWKEGFSTSGYFRRHEHVPHTHEGLLREFAETINGPDYADFRAETGSRGLLFGHNHLQCWCLAEGKLFLNPGSAGLPADFDNRPAYALLIEEAGGLTVAERRVDYDIEGTIRAARDTEIYARSPIWCELIFRTLRLGRDYEGPCLRFAEGLARQRGVAQRPFPNDLWREAYESFTARLDAGEFYPTVGEA